MVIFGGVSEPTRYSESGNWRDRIQHLPCLSSTKVYIKDPNNSWEKLLSYKSIPADKLKGMIKLPYDHFTMPNEIMNPGNDD